MKEIETSHTDMLIPFEKLDIRKIADQNIESIIERLVRPPSHPITIPRLQKLILNETGETHNRYTRLGNC